MSDQGTSRQENATGTTEVTRVEYDWSRTNPSTAVVETVAVVTDAEPTTMPPLSATVDADALDTILRGGSRPPTDGSIRVSFTYGSHEVTVGHAGQVVVESQS